MRTNIKRELNGEITLSITMSFEGSCLCQEENLGLALNELGLLSTAEILKSYDSEASQIEVSGISYSSKGSKKKSMNVHMGK
jgi:hypothetical protein